MTQNYQDQYEEKNLSIQNNLGYADTTCAYVAENNKYTQGCNFTKLVGHRYCSIHKSQETKDLFQRLISSREQLLKDDDLPPLSNESSESGDSEWDTLDSPTDKKISPKLESISKILQKLDISHGGGDSLGINYQFNDFDADEDKPLLSSLYTNRSNITDILCGSTYGGVIMERSTDEFENIFRPEDSLIFKNKVRVSLDNDHLSKENYEKVKKLSDEAHDRINLQFKTWEELSSQNKIVLGTDNSIPEAPPLNSIPEFAICKDSNCSEISTNSEYCDIHQKGSVTYPTIPLSKSPITDQEKKAIVQRNMPAVLKECEETSRTRELRIDNEREKKLQVARDEHKDLAISSIPSSSKTLFPLLKWTNRNTSDRFRGDLDIQPINDQEYREDIEIRRPNWAEFTFYEEKTPSKFIFNKNSGDRFRGDLEIKSDNPLNSREVLTKGYFAEHNKEIDPDFRENDKHSYLD